MRTLKILMLAVILLWAGLAAAGETLIKNAEFLAWSKSDGPHRLGPDKVTNGGFVGPVYWSAYNGAWASVAGGQSDNCCELTGDGTRPTLYQDVTGLEIDKLYELSFYVKGFTETTWYAYISDGSSDDNKIYVNNAAHGEDQDCSIHSWWKQTMVFRATGTSHRVNLIMELIDADGETIGFDTVELYEVVPGNTATSADAPDKWEKTSTLDLTRQYRDSSYTTTGSFYSVKATKGTSGNEHLSQIFCSGERDCARYAGESFSFGADIYSVSVTDNVKLYAYDGTTTFYSASYADANAWEWQSLTVTCANGLTELTVGWSFNGDTSDIAYVQNPMLDYDKMLVAGGYIPRRGETIWLDEPFMVTNSSHGKYMITQMDPVHDNIEAMSEGAMGIGIAAVLIDFRGFSSYYDPNVCIKGVDIGMIGLMQGFFMGGANADAMHGLITGQGWVPLDPSTGHIRVDSGVTKLQSFISGSRLYLKAIQTR